VCDSNHKNWGLKTPTITRLLENRAHSYGRLSKLLETLVLISAPTPRSLTSFRKEGSAFCRKFNFFKSKGIQMAISTNGTVIARLAGGLYNTVMSNATYLEVASQDPSTLANTLYARDFAKSTDLAVATTLLANLAWLHKLVWTLWVAAQLTAAGAANKGAKIVSLLNDFAGSVNNCWSFYLNSYLRRLCRWWSWKRYIDN
jgi:hypothetical protein